MRTDLDAKKDYILDELKTGRTRSSLSSELQCKQQTLVSRLTRWGVPKLPPGGVHRLPPRPKRSVEEYLTEAGTVKSLFLKTKLVRSGLKDWKCEGCGITEWLGNPAPLQLDHINGIKSDNRIENLRILCPNCHALTPTFCGRNKKTKEGVGRMTRGYRKSSVAWPSTDELSALVKDTPVSTVAKTLGVSGVAVAKRCRVLGIPLHPRGYWTTLKSGW